MDLTVDFKRTQIGLIPADWELKPLKQISPAQGVGLVINPSTYFDAAGTVPMLVGSNIKENHIVWETANRISVASNQSLSSSRLSAGDLVTVRVGDPGVTAVVPLELDGCNCASVMIVRKHHSYNSHWLCSVMNSQIGLSQIGNVQYGTAQKQFNISDAVNFLYPVPPLSEQQAIAEALSDADALIDALEQLIDKKRQIKKGAMQELLTGKRRLPGSEENWVEKTIDEIAFVDPENLGANTDPNYCFNYISLEDVSQGRLLGTTEMMFRDAPSRARRCAIRDDVLFGTVRPNLMSHYIVRKKGDDLVCSTGFAVIRCKDDQSVPEFVFISLFSNNVNRQVERLIAGSNYPAISSGQVKGIRINLPPLKEQIAISNVLVDMDSEISAFEAKLSKARKIKQGMMQELLTGRIRLV